MRCVMTLTLLTTLLSPLGCSPSDIPEEAEESAAAAAQAEYPDEIGSMTAYYTGGPQQGRPPDGQLWPGTPVKVLQDAGSYSLIRTADGIEAYVATAAIGPPGVNFK